MINKNQKSAKKAFDYNSIIIIASTLVLVVRYMGAFISSDVVKIPEWLSELLTTGIGISGMGMGLLDGLGGAVIFQGWRVAMPGRDKKWSFKFIILTIFVFLIILNGIVVMLPFTVMRTAGVSMIDVLGNNYSGPLWLWGIAVNVAPYFIIGGVMASSSVNFDLEKAKSTALEQKEIENNDKKPSANNEEKSNNEQNKEEKPLAKKWDWRKVSVGFSEGTLVAIAKTKPGELGVIYPGMDFQLERIWRRRSKKALKEQYGYTVQKFKEMKIKIKDDLEEENSPPPS